MSVNAMKWAWDQTTGDITAKSVLLALSDWASDHGHGLDVCWHCHETIAKRVEGNPRTVERALAYLEANGFVKRERRHREDGGRLSDRIFICTDRPANQPLISRKELTGRKVQGEGNGLKVQGGVDAECVTPRTQSTSNLKDRTSNVEPMSEASSDESVSSKAAGRGEPEKGREEEQPSGKPKAKPKKSGAPKYTEGFERCWQVFPCKNRMSKAAAFKSWVRQGCEDEVDAIHVGVLAYKAQIQKDGTEERHVKHMQGWLTDRRWECYAPDASEEREQQIKALALDLQEGHREELQYARKWWPSWLNVPQMLRDAARAFQEANFGQQEAFA